VFYAITITITMTIMLIITEIKQRARIDVWAGRGGKLRGNRVAREHRGCVS
jgi:hypothetical protein